MNFHDGTFPERNQGMQVVHPTTCLSPSSPPSSPLLLKLAVTTPTSLGTCSRIPWGRWWTIASVSLWRVTALRDQHKKRKCTITKSGLNRILTVVQGSYWEFKLDFQGVFAQSTNLYDWLCWCLRGGDRLRLCRCHRFSLGDQLRLWLQLGLLLRLLQCLVDVFGFLKKLFFSNNRWSPPRRPGPSHFPLRFFTPSTPPPARSFAFPTPFL